MDGVEISSADANMAEECTPSVLIRQLVERGALLRIEEKIAQDLSKQEIPMFCALLAFARQGHLCLEIHAGKINPSLDSLIADRSLVNQWEAAILKTPRKSSSSFVYFDERFYLPKYWELEERLVEQVISINSRNVKPIPVPQLPESLTEEQKEAVALACTHPLSLITGGPGTGKTSVALEVAKAFALSGRPFISLSAPTGKAVSHLASKIEGLTPHLSYGTLHSLLGVKNVADLYTKKEHPLPADLLIVDEGSMVDTALFTRMLSAIGPHTHLLIMGDANQLPAVEGGSVFSDLINGGIPCQRLSKVFRTGRKEILSAAHGILEEGILHTTLDLGLKEGKMRPFYENLWKHVHPLFPKVQKTRPDPIQLLEESAQFRILSTLRRGIFGVDHINAFLKERLTSLVEPGDFLPLPIMVIQNDKETELSNGQTGILIQQMGADAIAYFPGGRAFALHELPPFHYAFCLSVHKSQGSEYDHVLLLVPEGSESFGREVLYTGVTRAKEQLEIDGHPESIARALAQTSGKFSGIFAKLTS